MNASSNMSEQKAHAWSLIQNGQLDAARKLSRKLCKTYKNDPQCWYLLALTNSRSGHYPEAVKGYQKALRLAPGFTEASYNLALTYQFSGMLPEAVKCFQRSIDLKPDFADAYYSLGNCHYNLGDYSRAVEAYRTALTHRPDFIDAKFNLGMALQNLGEMNSAEQILLSALGHGNTAIAHLHLGRLYKAWNQHQKAVDSYTRSLAIEPTSATAWIQLGSLYESIGQMDLARGSYSKAVEYEPRLVEAHHKLGAIYFQTSELSKAQQCFEKALDLDCTHTDSLVGMGSVKVSQGNLKEGLEHTNRAIDADSDNPNALTLKAKIYEQTGKLDEALETLQPVVAGSSVNAAAAAVYANVCYSKKLYHEGITYLENLLKRSNLSNWEQQQFQFSLGKLYDAAEKYDDAFSHYQAGNELKFCHYHPGQVTAKTDRIIEIFSRDYGARLASSARTTDRPVFIIGMPRSGTSLVEQIISRHPLVTGGGELTFLHDITVRMNAGNNTEQHYPDCLETMATDNLAILADEYLGLTSGLHNEGTLLTDKLPENFLHLGLISLLFPSAIIIHCRRNPVDTCLSCYFQDFLGDLSFSYNLDHLAHYYKEYDRLMQHWESVLEIPLLNVDYEKLVQDQEKASRDIVAFCGLEWDPQCLEFDASGRFVRTASYDQVRRPIYNSSVDRWKHYRNHIAPLLPLTGQE